jgi:hypothetical protein
MEVGDSFAVDVPEGITAKDVAQILRRDADGFRRIRESFRVAVRVEEGAGSVRLWREPDAVPDRAKDAASASEKLDQALARKPSLGLRTRRKAAQ